MPLLMRFKKKSSLLLLETCTIFDSSNFVYSPGLPNCLNTHRPLYALCANCRFVLAEGGFILHVVRQVRCARTIESVLVNCNTQ